MSLNEGIWAGAIILFALLATAVILLGMRKHRSPVPSVLALLGSGILMYTMYVDYSTLTELIGFAVLAGATFLDYRMRRWAGVRREKKRVSRPSHGAPVGTGQSSPSL